MIQIRQLLPDLRFTTHEGAEALSALDREGAVTWVILRRPSPEELAQVQDRFALHPIMAEDLSQKEDRPRLRFYDKLTTITFFSVRQAEPFQVRFHPLHMLMGPGFLLTVTDDMQEELDEAWERWAANVQTHEHNEEAPLYNILDTLVDRYFPIVDAIAERLDDLEDVLLEQNDPGARREVYVLKKSLLRFRRVAASGRDVVNMLLRHDESTPDMDSIYLRDVYDNLNRVTDAIDTYRDLLSNTLDAQFAVISNRLNVIMQVLTAWSIILGSGTFIAGLYGMNVAWLPGAGQPHGFWIALGLCLVVGGILYGVFHRKRWV